MHAPTLRVPYTAVGLISAAALAYEILLTRVFAIVHWHHLVATAISLALLGYGASGTFLAILGGRLRPHFAPLFIANALLFGLSSVACVALAQQMPFDPQALSWEWRQLLYLAGTFLVLAIPFFAAANCIGLALWHFDTKIPRLYGFDLIGAGIGAFALLAGLAVLPPAGVLSAIGVAGALVAVSAAWTLRWHTGAVALAALLLTLGLLLWGAPGIHPAPYKDLARTLAAAGATLDYQRSGVAGTLSVVRNEQVPLRVAPGLSLNARALPPEQLAVFADGDAAGALGAFAQQPGATDYLADLSSALPYALLASPRVAVLNAGVGLGIAQALALGAREVMAIEPNPLLHQATCGRYAALSGALCWHPPVEWSLQAARTYLAGPHRQFDLITLTVGADAAGLDALKIDFDITREALLNYLGHLSPDGLLAIEGPTRVPPRLSLRLLATAGAALRQHAITAPGEHIAMLRGWQRFTLLVSSAPLTPARDRTIRDFARTQGFDLVWLPGIQATDANRYQQLNTPHFYLGATAILAGDPHAPSGSDDVSTIRPATDDAPFPYRFTGWPELWSALSSGDPMRLARLDTGLLIGTVTLALVSTIGIALILFPLFWITTDYQRATRPPSRLRTLLYFALLGIAFLFMEIAWIQRLQLFLGHPVYATTAVLVAFLVFAGLGSLWSQRHGRPQHASGALLPAVMTIALLGLAFLLYLTPALEALAGLPLGARIGIVLGMLAPLAFAMGIPFPTGLRALRGPASGLLPWAWGINGCASVISAAAAPLVAMEIGFSGLIGIASLAYLLLPAIRPQGTAGTGQEGQEPKPRPGWSGDQ